MDYGCAVRLEPSPPSAVIRVKIEQPYISGTNYWRTIFEFPDEDYCRFLVALDPVRAGLRLINRDLETSVLSKFPPEVIVSNLHDIGSRLTELLLVNATESATSRERARLVERLAESHLPILFDFNLPVPVELLVFNEKIGGIGDFAGMLGARTACWFSNRPPRGRTVGAGAALFHDNQLTSVNRGHIKTSVATAFEDIDEHKPLLDSGLAAAKTEIDRLFYGDSAWAHFQCHNEGGHSLRMTRNFFAGFDRFSRESREMAAILLNCCSATERSDCDPDGDRLTSSWGDHFSGRLHVPAVIGPLCALKDEETVAFANALYGELRRHPTIFQAFCAAKQHLLQTGDFAGVLYRFVGARSLVAPLQKQQGLRILAYSDAA